MPVFIFNWMLTGFDYVDIGWPKKAFQQKNWARPAQFTQLHRFFEVQQPKAVGSAQTGKHAREAMPVGISFDDGPDFRLRRIAPRDSEVIGESGGMNRGGKGARHGIFS
jgi:hypothetical protein